MRTTNGTVQKKRAWGLDEEQIRAIGQQMVRKIRATSKAMGTPIVFYKNGAIQYELPDGTITQTPPPGFENCARDKVAL